MNDGILAGRRRCGILKLDIYVCERSEQEKKSDYLKLKKNQQPKTISATKNRIKKLCFGDFRWGVGGGGRTGAPTPLESASTSSLCVPSFALVLDVGHCTLVLFIGPLTRLIMIGSG